MKEKDIGITVKKEDDMPEWYSQVVLKAELADHSPIKGCMVIRPNGYAIWQNIVDFFDSNIKKLGVENAYFPLFIPESFFQKEKEHAAGFKPEVAWVMNKDEESKEKLALRPTSETIMYDSYSNWIRSWRDLPLRINQWCNIIRWEVKDVKLFLRSREFLWQEGHCVYETEQECHKETLQYLEEYRKVAEELLAIPVLIGEKSEKERFAGAKATYAIEAFMPDGKALQLGTSHDLGQGFAKVFGISFIGKDEKEKTPWQNSWGISTRMIGGMVMTHADNKGIVIPPKAAPIKAVIVPIIFKKQKKDVLKKCKELKDMFDFDVKVDDREEYSAGWKFNEWELKGVPLRIEIGPNDLKKNQAVLVRRDNGKKEVVKLSQLTKKVDSTLEDIQKSLFSKAKKFLKKSIVEVNNWKSFEAAVKNRKMIKAPFCGEEKCEDIIKAKTDGASSRVIPFKEKKPKGKCVNCDKKAEAFAYFSKAY